MNASISPAAKPTLALEGADISRALPEDQEQLIAEIFELDPQELASFEQDPAAHAGVVIESADTEAQPDVDAVIESDEADVDDERDNRSTFAQERARASQPGSPERDFWENVAQLEEELAQSGQASAERVQAAIALAATQLSLNSPSGPVGGQPGAPPGPPGANPIMNVVSSSSDSSLAAADSSTARNDGVAHLVSHQQQLSQRAAEAVAGAQSLRGSALRASGRS